MRLLNIWTLQFNEFRQNELPSYAIASHRWGEDEATYKDIKKERNVNAAGYKKVRDFCGLVGLMNREVQTSPAWKAMGFHLTCDWIWIDTACINRTDSVELSESINSMFEWYRKAAVCYAYLADVRTIGDYQGAMLDFMQSKWFTRGWTLQELVGPEIVVFLTKDWEVLGHKCRHEKRQCGIICRGFGQRLDFVISRITNIPLEVIKDYRYARDLSVDKKMDWMQHRLTTRPEDRAYCLLGICEVFVVPIYGEGQNAWDRLQAAIAEKQKSNRLAYNREELSPSSSGTGPVAVQNYVPRSKTDAAESRALSAGLVLPSRARTDGEERRLRGLPHPGRSPVSPTYHLPAAISRVVDIPSLPANTSSLPPQPQMDVPQDWRVNRDFYRRFHVQRVGFGAGYWPTVADQSTPLLKSSSGGPPFLRLLSQCDYCKDHIFAGQQTVMCEYYGCPRSLYHTRCTDVSRVGKDVWYCWQCRQSPYLRNLPRTDLQEVSVKDILQPPMSKTQASISQADLMKNVSLPARTNKNAVLPRLEVADIPAADVGNPQNSSAVVQKQLNPHIKLEGIGCIKSNPGSGPNDLATATVPIRISSIRRQMSRDSGAAGAALKRRPTLPKWSVTSFLRSGRTIPTATILEDTTTKDTPTKAGGGSSEID